MDFYLKDKNYDINNSYGCYFYGGLLYFWIVYFIFCFFENWLNFELNN